MTLHRMKLWLAAAALAVCSASGVAACETPDGAAVLRDGIISWINTVRRDRGLPALRPSAALQASATGHACDMARRGFFAHEGPGGPSFSRRLKKVGYRYRAANENIAKTHAAALESAIRLWRDSPPHWANVMDRQVREVGVGIAFGDGRIFWVMDAGAS